ncbi:MAG: hypothetical protein RQ833_12305, partial [Sphingomonadaceae bacterium]|nr:hypothetical protein [Sphingomonadaceae bacterium]
MDVTALLVAARLDLLEAVESGTDGIAIPASVPMVLLAMETGCKSRSDTSLVDRIIAAGISPVEIDDAVPVRIVAASGDDGVQDLSGGGTRSTLQALVASMVERHALTSEVAAATLAGLSEASDGVAPPEG